MYGMIVFCVVDCEVPSPCRKSNYKLELVLVDICVSCSQEDVSKDTSLIYDFVSIVLSVCGINLFEGCIWET